MHITICAFILFSFACKGLSVSKFLLYGSITSKIRKRYEKHTFEYSMYLTDFTRKYQELGIKWAWILMSSNIVGCSCTWQRYLSRETNTEDIPALNQSYGGCNSTTSYWPYQGHQGLYLVPRTTNCLSTLWSNTDHWPFAPGVCSVVGMSWRILHCLLIEYSFRDNYRDLHSGILTRCGILLSDMNGRTFYTIPDWNHPRSDTVC